MTLNIQKAKNKNTEKANEKFMASESNQMGAEYMLKQKVNDKEWTKAEFIEHARKHGYLKTEKDKQIVEHVIQTSGIKENAKLEEMRQQRRKIDNWADREVAKYIEITPERRIFKKIEKKYF